MRQLEYAHGVRTRQRSAQRACRAMRGMGKRQLILVLGRLSTRKAGKAGCKADGDRVTDGS